MNVSSGDHVTLAMKSEATKQLRLVHGVVALSNPEHAAFVVNLTGDRIKQTTRAHASEGRLWIRGAHTEESPEARALLTVRALDS